MVKTDVITLLSDEKYLKSVTVPEAADHSEKYTVYKIILQATPEKTLDNETFQFVLWRRYRDIHKLHLKLEMVHKQLYLKGQYPDLAKPEYFGRREPHVVEERRQTTENFLDFVVKNNIMCKTDALHAFFQGAELIKKNSDDDAPSSPVLQPMIVTSSFSVSSDDGDELLDEPSTSAPSQEDHEAAHPPKNLEIFDPFASVNVAEKFTVSNFELLSTVVNDSKPEETECLPQHTYEENNQELTAAADNQKVIPKNGSVTNILKANFSVEKPLRIIRSTGNLPCARSMSPSTVSTTTAWFKKFTSSPMKKSQNNVAADYLVQAGEFISAAQKSEAEGVFDFAFTLYKSAVLLLLSGVQEEKDLDRRNAVRVQLTKYLRRAEKLYRRYLVSDSSEEFVIGSFPVNFLKLLKGHYSELKQYKSVGVLGATIQLVQEIQTNDLYALKVVDKSCYDAHLNQVLSLCVPVRVPHMVKLIRFWELNHCIILLLEYATNGKLWEYLKSYFKIKRQKFLKSSYFHFHSPRNNTRKILFRIGDTESEVIGSTRMSLELECDDGLHKTDLEHADQHECKMFNEEFYEIYIRKWTAQIINALSHLHAEGMICRDLNPNNLLLDEANNILLSYFCALDCQYRRLDAVCRDTCYCAPELLYFNEDPVSKNCDWWSLGVILYELATGLPLHLIYPQGFTSHSILTFSDDISAELKDLISKLLRFDVDERLGCGIDGDEILKSHPFFDGISWAKLEF